MKVKELKNILAQIEDDNIEVFLETFNSNEPKKVILVKEVDEDDPSISEEYIIIADNTENIEYELEEQGNAEVVQSWELCN